jgi:hypothetical protein
MQKSDFTSKQPVWKPAFSLFLSHLGGLLVALVFCVGLTPWMTTNMVYVCIAVVLFLYSLPVYRTMWGLGHEDRNRANFGHIRLDRFRGLKLALIAYSPNLLMGILFFLSKFNIFPWAFVPLYKILNGELWPIINAIQISWYMTDYSILQTIAVSLLPLLPVLIAAGGYLLGTHDFSIYHRLIYRDQKPAKKN